MHIGKSKHLQFVATWLAHSSLNAVVLCGSYIRAKELFTEIDEFNGQMPRSIQVRHLRLEDSLLGGSLTYQYTRESMLGREIQRLWIDESTPIDMRVSARARVRPKSIVLFKSETTDQTCVHPDQKSVQYTCEQVKENRMFSAHDGSVLPHWWQSALQKDEILFLLRGRKPLFAMPVWWKTKPYTERMGVIHHLVASGELLEWQYEALVGRSFKSAGRLNPLARAVTPYVEMTRTNQNRMLPSIYTKLTTHWLCRSGEYIDPRCMDLKHLRNAINLLNEAHGNFVAKACLVAGKIHAHLDCDPATQEHLKATCLEMQKIDISKLYPIFDVLVKEYQFKLNSPPPPEIDRSIDTLHPDLDLEWDDK